MSCASIPLPSNMVGLSWQPGYGRGLARGAVYSRVDVAVERATRGNKNVIGRKLI